MYYERLNFEMLQTEIMVMRDQVPNWERLCKYCRWLWIYLLLEGKYAVAFKSCFDWVLQETFPILCRNPGIGDFLQLWTTWKSSLPLFELKTDCGAISPFPKMNKHEQMPIWLRSLLCWRLRMWTLERVWLDLRKTALIRALGGIWYRVRLRATES